MMNGEEQRRFIRVPAATIKSCVDRMGVRASEEVVTGLAEDVSFRVRQIAENACQFMHHAKRRCLSAEDMERAMTCAGLEPVLGCQSELPCQYGDHVLEQVASAPLPPGDENSLPNPIPMVTASWLAVEGVKLGEEETLQGKVELSCPESQPHQEFLSLILRGVTGEDEEQRKIALAAVETKPAVASILPGLCQYLQQTLSTWEQFTPEQLQQVLKLVLAVCSNKGLFLAPYASNLYPLLRDILVAPGYLSQEGRVHHWHVRSMAAAAMAQLLKRCWAPLTQSRQELFALFQQQFSHASQASTHTPQSSTPTPQTPVPVLYGAVLVLCCLGYASIMEVLVPHLPGLLTFCGSVGSTGKDGSSRLLEAIMLTAKVLLTSEERDSFLLSPRPSPTQTAISKRAGVKPPPVRTALMNGGSVGGDPVPSIGEVLDLTSGPVMMDTTAPPTLLAVASPSPSPPSLYDYLEELFGEGLNLYLFGPAHISSGGTANASKPAPSKTSQESSKSSSSASKRETRSLERFLSGEGFKPIQVQLPKRAPPPPSVPRGYYKGREPWTFSLPQTVLPVPGNVLDQQPGAHHAASNTPPSAVVKGACAGLHRRRPGGHCPVDMAAWI